MKKLAFIPARAGSKRLPNKNRLLLRGRPLISYTIESVIESDIFDVIVVSTDDAAILDVAKHYSGITLHNRSKNLAGDSVTVTQVLVSFLQEEKCHYDLCGVFPPTSPFRNATHIKEACCLLKTNIDNVISVMKYAFPPSFRMNLNPDGTLSIPSSSPLINGNTQTGNQKVQVHPNGAIYLSWAKSLLVYRNFFSGRITGYLMNRRDSIDIDEKFDLISAEMFFDLDYE